MGHLHGLGVELLMFLEHGELFHPLFQQMSHKHY